MFPEIFALPSTRVPDGLPGLQRRAQMLVSRGMQYLTWTAFGHRHSWQSPYTYEHHKNLIAGPLREKFLAAMDTVCDFLGLARIEVDFSRRTIYTGTAFRVMALARLIEAG
jgi:hypothetical protein